MTDFLPATIKELGFALSAMVLLGYIARLIIPYLLKKLDEKDKKMGDLVEGFKKTTDGFVVTTQNFLEASNHKTTAHTEAINKLNETQVELVKFLKKRK